MASRRKKKSRGKVNGSAAEEHAAEVTSIDALKDIVRAAKAEYDELYSDLESARAKVKGINKSIGDVFRDLKNDAGITRDVAERKFKEANMEADKRDEIHDQELLIFQSLGIGEQMDWIKTQERIEARIQETRAENDANDPDAFDGKRDPRPSHLKERDRQRADT